MIMVREMLLEQWAIWVLVGGHEPAVEPAAGCVSGCYGSQKRWSEKHHEGPPGFPPAQRGLQLGVRFQHDVNDSCELVAGEVERDVCGYVGEHLRFEDDRHAGIRSEQHGVGFRRSFQPCACGFRSLSQVWDGRTLVEVIAEPELVAGRGWEVGFEIEFSAPESASSHRANGAGGRKPPFSSRRLNSWLRAAPPSSWYRLISAVATQNLSSFSICRPSRICAGVGLSPSESRSACIFACFTLAR